MSTDSPKFIGIAVGQGDSFFVQRRDVTVLVDGGLAEQGFPTQFQNTVKRQSVDIMICTHNDADHAEGLIGYLEAGLTASEVWLPGKWTDRLDDLLHSPSLVADELLQQIGRVPFEESADHIRLSRFVDMPNEQREGSDENITSLSETIGQACYRSHIVYGYDVLASTVQFQPTLVNVLGKARLDLYAEALAAAARIRRLVLAAYRSGAIIRWFEYDGEQSSGGKPGRIVPVNARELAITRLRRYSMLRYLALSVFNRESLVFILTGDGDHPPILFSGDSDFAFRQPINWSDGMIITAPHHGSESNNNAYRRFEKDTWPKQEITAIWVRSDGKFYSRPGESYKSVNGRRYCTWCRDYQAPKQHVRFSVRASKWCPVSTHGCECT